MRLPSFQSVGLSTSYRILRCNSSTLVSMSALFAYLPFFNCLMALLFSSSVGVKHLIGRSLVAGRIAGWFLGAGLFISSWNRSIHLVFLSCYYSFIFVSHWPLCFGKMSC
ncbi:hypothetical protein DPMN_041075 [Dreissena polymorpha]|uniref:Uncharacterized protein n=1 Tax=Dreissena polymorpha TaxID=45954 RepID=A0A9D4HXJ3_DREPO|nr:hypothetical protein DPMN_041075 [Dreissena polymorpha]